MVYGNNGNNGNLPMPIPVINRYPVNSALVLFSEKVVVNPAPIIIKIPPIIHNILYDIMVVRDTNCPVIITVKTTLIIRGNNSIPALVAIYGSRIMCKKL
jgi:hypothetical protein